MPVFFRLAPLYLSPQRFLEITVVVEVSQSVVPGPPPGQAVQPGVLDGQLLIP